VAGPKTLCVVTAGALRIVIGWNNTELKRHYLIGSHAIKHPLGERFDWTPPGFIWTVSNPALALRVGLYCCRESRCQEKLKKMDTVRRILERCNLQKYVESFESNGYDSGDHLLYMGPDEFKQLAMDCNILPGHLARLKRYISDVHNRFCTPAGPNEARALEPEAEAESEAAAASCVFVSSEGPEEFTISSSQESAAELAYKCVLEEEYESWEEAKVASL